MCAVACTCVRLELLQGVRMQLQILALLTATHGRQEARVIVLSVFMCSSVAAHHWSSTACYTPVSHVDSKLRSAQPLLLLVVLFGVADKLASAEAELRELQKQLDAAKAEAAAAKAESEAAAQQLQKEREQQVCCNAARAKHIACQCVRLRALHCRAFLTSSSTVAQCYDYTVTVLLLWFL